VRKAEDAKTVVDGYHYRRQKDDAVNLSLLKRFMRVSLFLTAFVACAQTPFADFFVSPLGNDAWSGTRATPNAARTDGPFASVARAQAALRELLQAKPNHTRTVILRGGTYYLPFRKTAPGTLAFTAADSGTTAYPVIWRSYPGETPIIIGGNRSGRADWGWRNSLVRRQSEPERPRPVGSRIER
jgi:hypothetical protein